MKGNGPTRANSVRLFTARAKGVKIAIFAIVSKCGTQLFRPSGYLFRYVFIRGLCPSHFTAFAFAALGDVDVFAPSFFPPPFLLTFLVHSGLFLGRL